MSEDGREALGAFLTSGEFVDADVVVVNADLVYAYNHLLPKSAYAKRLSKRQTSCSSISFFWSFNIRLAPLQGHNVFLANHYRESFDHIFKDNRIPDEPSFYVHIPNRFDPSASPEGTDALVVLVPTGHLGNIESANQKNDPKYWDSIVQKTKEKVLSILEERTGVSNLQSMLVGDKVETPLTWKSKYNLDRGAILGISHSFFNVLSFRPKTRHPQINNLFFVGASTHPGTGVPICLAGSKLVSKQVITAARGKRLWNPHFGRLNWGYAIIVMVVVLSIFFPQFLEGLCRKIAPFKR